MTDLPPQTPIGPAHALARSARDLGREFQESAGRWWWNSLVASPLVPPSLRRRLLLARPRTRIGHGGMIMEHCVFDRNPLTVGDRVFINRGCSFLGSGEITVGDDVALGFDAMLVTVGHDGEHEDRRAALGWEKPVVVGRGAWIGARAVILPGVTIGEGCIIAAGAVVTEDCEPHTACGGVPAVALKSLPRGKRHHAP